MERSSGPLRASPAAVFRPLDQGGVVLNIESGAYYELNPTGRFLWEHVVAGHDRNAIAAALVDRYGIDEAAARSDVDAFLDDLNDRQLLEP